MAELVVDGESLTVSLSSRERIGALRHSDLTVARAHIASVERVAAGHVHVRGLRMPGTHIPGKVLLGTFVEKGTRTFAAVYRNEAAYVITLHDEKYNRLVISGPENTAVAELGPAT